MAAPVDNSISAAAENELSEKRAGEASFEEAAAESSSEDFGAEQKTQPAGLQSGNRSMDCSTAVSDTEADTNIPTQTPNLETHHENKDDSQPGQNSECESTGDANRFVEESKSDEIEVVGNTDQKQTVKVPALKSQDEASSQVLPQSPHKCLSEKTPPPKHGAENAVSDIQKPFLGDSLDSEASDGSPAIGNQKSVEETKNSSDEMSDRKAGNSSEMEAGKTNKETDDPAGDAKQGPVREKSLDDNAVFTSSGYQPATKEDRPVREMLVRRNRSESSECHTKTGNETSDGRPVREMLVRRTRSESSETSVSDRPVLEPLTFGATKEEEPGDIEGKTKKNSEVCPCVLCERSYPADNKEDILAHLVLMHKFVIADVNYIANLPAYLRYWKKRLEEKPVTDFCSKIVTNTGSKDTAPKEEFFLLCDASKEDKDIREFLQRKKLESVLEQQQREREETKFCRQCLFCKQTFCGNRAVLFDHLLRDHTFHMGQPDNLVFTDELFDLIQCKLDNQLCLFCEKSFKDKASLREHMRKKQHRKINPKNKEYDRFYIINYMEMGKNWESLQSEDNRLVKTNEVVSDEEEEWAGWEEESEPKVVCLFCDSACAVQTDLQNHMKDKHSFDLQEVNQKLQLNFYQKVKLINYIRRQIYHKTCYGCQETLSDKSELNHHLEECSDHLQKIPAAEVWDQPQYFFPTYEDDTLLCHLDDDDEGAAGDALGVTVIAEEIPVSDTILKDQKICRDLLKA